MHLDLETKYRCGNIHLIIAYWYSVAFSIVKTYILMGIFHHNRGFSYDDVRHISLAGNQMGNIKEQK